MRIEIRRRRMSSKAGVIKEVERFILLFEIKKVFRAKACETQTWVSGIEKLKKAVKYVKSGWIRPIELEIFFPIFWKRVEGVIEDPSG